MNVCRIMPFVALRSIKTGEKFFTSFDGNDATKGGNGEVWYEVLGFANTVEEAQKILWPTHLDEVIDLTAYLSTTFARMESMGIEMSKDGKDEIMKLALEH